MAKRHSKKVRRSFSDEYKAEVVEMIRLGDQSVAQVCRNLDLSDSMVRRWIRDTEVKKPSDGNGSAEESDADELRRLRREVKQLKMEREILKKAAAFFAKEST